ncbi:CoA transferase [Frankia sp. Cj3]|uniref:CoA transferase n=1 Tax=Frankia sp. Cj3 TaxID=2880976 RepID=UPI001EF461E3|nr:CoA transferase [Frankia sp. Cj3]
MVSLPLSGMTVLTSDDPPAGTADAGGARVGSPALAAAVELLRGLGATVPRLGTTAAPAARPAVMATLAPIAVLDPMVELPPALTWARSGAMALTGPAGGAPLAPELPVVPRLDGAMAVFRLLAAARGRRVEVDAGALLGERAAISRLTRGGRRSAGGAARLLPTRDGWVAVNLARSSDRELLPAWLSIAGNDHDRDDHPVGLWDAVTVALARLPTHDVVEQGQLLGLPVAAAAQPKDAAQDDQAAARGQRFPFAPFLLDGTPISSASTDSTPTGTGHRPLPPTRPILVVDLSSLWAGPLCAHLLGLAGARVIKVESTRRPDGARSGPRAFFDLLHAGHESVALDLRTPDGRAALVRLMLRADVVIEASRPRALAQLGIDPAGLLARHPALTWVSITGYGRTGPWCQRVAFGDDAAAAAGLVAVGPDGTPMFLADAIADPVTGLYAAVAALACVVGGGGHHVDIALREAAGSLLGTRPRLPRRDPAARWSPGSDQDEDNPSGWFVAASGCRRPVLPPRHRMPAGTAPELGADTARVLAELA